MEKQQFFEEFYKILEPMAMEQGATLEKVDVPKNNEIWKGITVRFGEDPIAPTLYPERYREEVSYGSPLVETAKRALEEAMDGVRKMGKTFSMSLFNREHAKDFLRAAVVHYENNREMLKRTPHERIADLAVYARWDFGNGATARITDESLSCLAMTKEEMLKMAKEGTARRVKFQSMDEVIREMYRFDGMEEEMEDSIMASLPSSPLSVLSTKDGLDGAALIADRKILKSIHEKMGEDFYILPSSVHELLLLPKSEGMGDPKELKAIVSAINNEQVAPQDRLSDNVYQFDGQRLSIAGTEGIKREEGITSCFARRHSR